MRAKNTAVSLPTSSSIGRKLRTEAVSRLTAAAAICVFFCAPVHIISDVAALLVVVTKTSHPRTAAAYRKQQQERQRQQWSSSQRPLETRVFSTTSRIRPPLLLQAVTSSEEDISSTIASTTVSNNGGDDGIAAAKEFESWIRTSVKGAWVNDNLQHATFGKASLRGLAWKQSGNIRPGTKIATIPAEVVLSSDYSQKETWDRDLAVMLWKECQLLLGSQNSSSTALEGYIRLLTEGWNTTTTSQSPPPPPSTAPHSLRRWTAEQKAALFGTPAGRALVDLEQRQEMAWRQKYDSLDHIHIHHMTWWQFQWAMEAVHSRAFCGVQTAVTASSSANLFVSLPLLAPVLAAVIGYWYATASFNPSETVLAVLAVAAVLPSLVSMAQQQQHDEDGTAQKSAVLLPVIDSANHRDDADSNIVFDPIQRFFELTIGPACLVPTLSADTKTNTTATTTRQLCVNYGSKSDRELLLNYGFLSGVSYIDTDDDDEYRRSLALEFLQRNPL